MIVGREAVDGRLRRLELTNGSLVYPAATLIITKYRCGDTWRFGQRIE